MEVMELADLRKAFMPSKDRYLNPHAEAMRLRTLWTFHHRTSKTTDEENLREFFDQATNFLKTKDFFKAHALIKKGLFINPRSHSFYSLRGEIYSQQDKLDKAIDDYEEARKFFKLEKESNNQQSPYVKNLVDIYQRRGLKNYKEEKFMEAASDYEQILFLKPYGTIATEIQDRLLKTLRQMEKYEAFRCEWSRFMKKADPSRTSSLLTQHAEFKIFLREINSARHILLEAMELDSKNSQARELLQVIYDTGHHLVAFSITWSVSGCHDKALMAIEKARDCDPYNAGYTLLKAIMLRLSGRLLEAAKWLESVSKGFDKLLEPSKDRKGSIMGNLTIDQTRVQLIKQWYLIRYDIAVQFMLEKRYADALTILESSTLGDHFSEACTLMGDCMVKLGETDRALGSYLKGFAKVADLGKIDPSSRKNIHLLKRITDILNENCNKSIEEGQCQDAIKIAENIARILENISRPDSTILGHNLGEALVCKARADYHTKRLSKSDARTAMAQGFKLTRGADDHGIYRKIFDDKKLENIVDDFATARKLPNSLKLLMQYS